METVTSPRSSSAPGIPGGGSPRRATRSWQETRGSRLDFWRRGDAFVWISAGATGFALLLILGVLYLIAAGGLGFFWPATVEQIETTDGELYLGEIWERQAMPADLASTPGEHRIRVRAANRRENGPREFVWIPESKIRARTIPRGVVVLEREEYGNFIGYVTDYQVEGVVVARDAAALSRLEERVGPLSDLRNRILGLSRNDVGRINAETTRLQTEIRGYERRGTATTEKAEQVAKLRARITALETEYSELADEIDQLRLGLGKESVGLRTGDGREVRIGAGEVYRVILPNDLGFFGRAGVYFGRLVTFVTTSPRSANLDGGILPAIFGTVMMTFLMTIAVVPLGVVAGLYLREYARQGRLVRIVRIAVNNLAGVPSIVFGIFGLGFFVYFAGAAIDSAFFADQLPTPTFGTGGILWSALTLALLTIPVVIVATEEGLAAVPRAVREGSLALGASKWETTWKVVLPAASPGILTGVILAISRAAGEVAPLMLTGAVKTASLLPLDGTAPFLHLERKFMHLGFHIFDLGFQSPNVEAAKPMVYMTTFLLVVIVVLLNLTAMWIRNRLWSRYRSSSF